MIMVEKKLGFKYLSSANAKITKINLSVIVVSRDNKCKLNVSN